ncbi:hypothetical protein ACJW31_11G156200 [Castanea mollissima]
MRFQFVILKIITLLLNSGVTAANLPNLPPHGPHPILLLQVGLWACVYFFFQTRLPIAMARMTTGGPHF